MKETTCYFCNKPRKMLRNDMKVYVCADHEPREDPQEKLTAETCDGPATLTSFTAAPPAKPMMGKTGMYFRDVQHDSGVHRRVPPFVYYWWSREHQDFLYRDTKEAAEKASGLTGFDT